jgi:hypothetical protein
MLPEKPPIGKCFVIALVGGDDLMADDRVMECVIVDNDFWNQVSTMTDPTVWVHL